MSLGSRFVVVCSLVAAGMFGILRSACTRRSRKPTSALKQEENEKENRKELSSEIDPCTEMNDAVILHKRKYIHNDIHHMGQQMKMLSMSIKKIVRDMEGLRTDLHNEINTRRNQTSSFLVMMEQTQERMNQGFQEMGNAGEVIGFSFRQNAAGWNSQIQVLHDAAAMLGRRLASLEGLVLHTSAPGQSAGQAAVDTESTESLGSTSGDSMRMTTEKEDL